MISKINYVRGFVLAGVLTAAPCMLFAQTGTSTYPSTSQQTNGGSSQGQTTPGAMHSGSSAGENETGGAEGSGGESMRDKSFLRESAQGGLAEIKLGQLASQKAGSEEVKKFAQKMVEDHTTLNQSMMPIAERMGVKAPTEPSKKDEAEYSKLNELSGMEFDKEYTAYMVKDHHKDLREFREEASTTRDPELKSAVMKGEKVIQMHSHMADQLAAKNGGSAENK